MAIEVKDYVEFLALEKAPETIEELKELFPKQFIARSAAADDPEIKKQAASKLGNVIGKYETSLKQGFKELGLEKVEGDKIEDVLQSGITGLKTLMDSLKDKDKKTKSQRETELETDLNKYKGQYETAEQAREAANKLLAEKDKEVATFKKDWSIDQQLAEVFKAVNFTDDYQKDPIRQKGFKQFLNEEAQFDLNDKGELVALTKEGKPFSNPAGNVFKSPVEVLTELADKAKVKANNNMNPQRNQQQPQQQQPPVNNTGHGLLMRE